MQKLDEIIVIRDDKAKNHSVLILVRMEYALIVIYYDGHAVEAYPDHSASGLTIIKERFVSKRSMIASESKEVTEFQIVDKRLVRKGENCVTSPCEDGDGYRRYDYEYYSYEEWEYTLDNGVKLCYEHRV